MGNKSCSKYYIHVFEDVDLDMTDVNNICVSVIVIAV